MHIAYVPVSTIYCTKITRMTYIVLKFITEDMLSVK